MQHGEFPRRTLLGDSVNRGTRSPFYSGDHND
jgi:hypothetical protein